MKDTPIYLAILNITSWVGQKIQLWKINLKKNLNLDMKNI
jgi:hypothetical protein